MLVTIPAVTIMFYYNILNLGAVLVLLQSTVNVGVIIGGSTN